MPASRKLLVIDDRVETGRSISLAAEREGYDVRIAQDPRQAVTTCLAYQPDLIFLELIMPGMDGIEVLKGLMTTGVTAQIVLTASAGIGDAYVRIAHGVARFHGQPTHVVLRRPFRETELLKILRCVPIPDGGA